MNTKREIDSGPATTESRKPPTQSLSQLFQKCLQLYSLLYRALEEDDCEPVKLEYVDLEKARGEFGRLRLWGIQSKAALPAQARGSLDDTLRRDQAITDKVADMFRLLMDELDLALRIVRGKNVRPRESHAESGGSAAASDGDDSCTDSSDDDNDDDDGAVEEAKIGRKRAKISVVMSYIYDQVELLHHLSMLLRQPRLAGRDIKSAGGEGNPSAFAPFDYSHIVEKFRHWQHIANSGSEYFETRSQQALSSLCQEPEEQEQVLSENELQARLYMEATHGSYALMQRLARANTRRREQLKYWEVHPSRPGASLKDKAAENEARTQGGDWPRTIYEETVVATDRQPPTRVPDVPIRDPWEAFFECPFCHISLESSLMRDRQSWKQHVFRDLRPYLCTDDNCPSPDKMYATRHEWIYHEMQMHRRQWSCPHDDCYAIFDIQGSMVDHLRHKHSGSWTHSQLNVVLEVCEAPLDEARIVACPMCPNELYLSRLLTHLAKHMEEISLFVLPSVSEGEEDVGSHAIRGSRTMSLPFSIPDSTERSTGYERSFEELIASKELDSLAKVAGWIL